MPTNKKVIHISFDGINHNCTVYNGCNHPIAVYPSHTGFSIRPTKKGLFTSYDKQYFASRKDKPMFVLPRPREAMNVFPNLSNGSSTNFAALDIFTPKMSNITAGEFTGIPDDYYTYDIIVVSSLFANYSLANIQRLGADFVDRLYTPVKLYSKENGSTVLGAKGFEKVTMFPLDYYYNLFTTSNITPSFVSISKTLDFFKKNNYCSFGSNEYYYVENLFREKFSSASCVVNSQIAY